MPSQITREPVAAPGMHRARQDELTRVIAVANGKGGVGKTTITANVGGQLGEAEYRVLLIDLNHQGNLAEDLGYASVPDVDDQGERLMNSLVMRRRLEAVQVPGRPNLFVVPGGGHLADLTPVLTSRLTSGVTNGDTNRSALTVLADSLAPIAPAFDLVFIDCPPENLLLQDMAMIAAKWVLIPTKSDLGGVKGMRQLAERFQLAQQLNPQLSLLGVVLFATGSNFTAIHEEVRKRVADEFGGYQPMFDMIIRHSEKVGQQARTMGRLAHELEVALADQDAWWKALRDGQKPAQMLSSTTVGVASDYRMLAAAILDKLREAEEAQ